LNWPADGCVTTNSAEGRRSGHTGATDARGAEHGPPVHGGLRVDGRRGRGLGLI
jgi:hypothetical protein